MAHLLVAHSDLDGVLPVAPLLVPVLDQRNVNRTACLPTTKVERGRGEVQGKAGCNRASGERNVV